MNSINNISNNNNNNNINNINDINIFINTSGNTGTHVPVYPHFSFFTIYIFI